MIKKKANKIFGSRVAYIVLSVVIAISLWFYVVGTVNPEIDQTISSIPVTFVGEDEILADRGLMLTQGKDTTVSLRVRCTRSVLAKLDRKSILLSIDLTGFNSVGEYTRTYTITYPTGISASDVKVLSKTPAQVKFTIAKQDSKSVRLVGKLDGTVAEGYLAKDFEFSQPEITIRGPEEVISKVDHAVVTITRENVDKTIETTSGYTLVDNKGNEIDTDGIILETEEVEVRLPILQQKEIYLTVELRDGGGATAADADVAISPRSIIIAGDPETLKTYNNVTLGAFDLAEITGAVTETMPIVLMNGVENISGETEATVTVSLESLETRTFNVTQFAFKNVPQGFSATAVNDVLKVRVRGKRDTVGLLLDSNFTGVIDLAGNNTIGMVEVPVTVEIQTMTDAGIVGKYSMFVNIQKAEETTQVVFAP
ncbi:MAG: YbbR-like domain-containing protein [Oscillospiraceae bacterium]|jgi:YbbR domain-containing protein